MLIQQFSYNILQSWQKSLYQYTHFEGEKKSKERLEDKGNKSKEYHLLESIKNEDLRAPRVGFA